MLFGCTILKLIRTKEVLSIYYLKVWIITMIFFTSDVTKKKLISREAIIILLYWSYGLYEEYSVDKSTCDNSSNSFFFFLDICRYKVEIDTFSPAPLHFCFFNSSIVIFVIGVITDIYIEHLLNSDCVNIVPRGKSLFSLDEIYKREKPDDDGRFLARVWHLLRR